MDAILEWGRTVRVGVAWGMGLLLLGASAWGLPAASASGPASAASAVAPQDSLAALKAQAVRDPAAALAQGLALWSGQAGASPALRPQERVALGLALLEWSVSTRQGAALLSVGDGLRSLDMAPEQRTQRLKLLCNNLWMAKDKTRLAELEKELLPLKPGPGLSADEQADLWRALAASAVLMQDYPTGMRLAHAAMDHAPRHPHKVDYQAQQLLGVANVYQGKLPEAIEAMLAADRVGQALKLPDDPRLLHNFSGLFIYTKDWANVVAYGERALKALDDRSSITRDEVLTNIAAGYAGMGQSERAEALYKEAIAWAAGHGGQALSAMNNLADLLQQQGRQREALALLNEVAPIYERSGPANQAATVYSNLGAAQAALGQRESAARSYAKSLALFGRGDDVGVRLELYPRMIDNLEALGRYREALALMREFKTTHDDHVSVESKTRIAELQSVLEVERQKTQLAEASRTQVAQSIAMTALQERERWQRALGAGLLALVLLLSFTVVFKVRESRARAKLNTLLSQRNAEVEAQHRALAQAHETIRRQAEEDALTGVRSRRYGQAWLDQFAAARQQALAAHEVPATALVALLDLDHFKRLNDLHGHEVGDRALRHFAQVLGGCARASDVLVRWGGEEFLWVCPDTPLSEAGRLFARLQTGLREAPLELRGGPVRITVSAGFSVFPLGGAAPEDWGLTLRVADAALYRAKRAGRDRWEGLAGAEVAEDAPLDRPAWADTSVDTLEAMGLLQETRPGA